MPDIISSAASGHHSSEYEQRPKCRCRGLWGVGRILVTRPFACPSQLVGFLLQLNVNDIEEVLRPMDGTYGLTYVRSV